MRILLIVLLCIPMQAYGYFGHLLRPVPHPLYGVTVDDIYSNLNGIVDSLDSLSQTPTTRIVFDEFVPAKEYRPSVDAIREVSFIMGEILDSFYMRQYSVSKFKQRTDEYLNEFKEKVDIWEIGNEINGEWLGKTSDVVKKMTYAYDKVKEKGGRAALTLYYNKDCWSRSSNEMFTWAEANIPDHLKMGLDYVLISYFEEDCNNLRPDWPVIFQRLGEMFPTSKIGFGEVGTTKKSKKKEYLKRYYGLRISHPRYVGGYFWWWYKQDMVPKSKPLWKVLNNTIKTSPGNQGTDPTEDPGDGSNGDEGQTPSDGDDGDTGDGDQTEDPPNGDNGDGDQTQEDTNGVLDGAFGVPANFTATQKGRKVKLTWDDVAGERGYMLAWRKESNRRWKKRFIPAGMTKFVHRWVKLGNTYEYRIRAKRYKRKGGNSPWSDTVTIDVMER